MVLEPRQRSRDDSSKGSGTAGNLIDASNLFSWGETPDPFKAITKTPVMFSKAKELSDGPGPMIVICERTPQAACMGAWITSVANRCDMPAMLTFYGADEFNIDLDERGSIVTVGIPIDQHAFIEEVSAFGWKLYACPTKSSLEAMKVIAKSIGYRFHICTMPWARILLPRKKIPATFFELRTGHAGFDAIVEAAGATGADHPTLRRRVRQWVGVRLCEPALCHMSDLMIERDPHVAKILVDLVESVR